MTGPIRLSELQALACEDCDAAVTVQRGQGVAGTVLVVFVVHRASCPWAARCVPVGGASLITSGALLRHVREGESDVTDPGPGSGT